MSFPLRHSASVPSLSRWPLLALAALIILLLAAVSVLWSSADPAGAQDAHQPDPQVVNDVWDYANETQHGADHVLRWMRVLHTFGALDDMTAAEAQDHAEQFWAARWNPVVTELTNLEAQDDYQPDQQVVDDVRGYAAETDNGFDHVLRWMRVLHTLGALDDMTAAEAQGYADQYTAARWDPVVAELTAIETAASAAEPDPDPTATPEPNQAPVVNTQAEWHHDFVGQRNAPRGVLVWKMFHDIFSDPEGDDLTYTASVPPDQSQLVDDLQIRLGRTLSNGEKADILFFIADAEDDWKAISPTLPDRPVITVTLTATDPDGLSASVAGDFVIWWESYPEVVSARADGAAIVLTFDWAVESDPAPVPEQFTVHVVNEDGTAGTVEVNRVSVSERVMTLELASALDESQTVTLDYAYNYPDDTPLQRAGGGDAAPSFTGQAVAFLQPPGEPQNFAVSAEPGSLDIAATWDALDGADTYKLRWRQSGGEFDAANATTVSDTSATVTVPEPGQWEVQLQGCNDAGCGPSVSQTVGISPGEPENFTLEAVQGRLDILARWQGVTGAISYKLRWRLADGQFDADDAITISDDPAVITVSETGQWEVRLQACNDAGCGPEASRTVDVVQELQLNLAQARDAEGNVRPGTITAAWESVPGAAAYTLRWWREGANPQTPATERSSRQRNAAGGPSETSGDNGQGANQLTTLANRTSAEFHVTDYGEYTAELEAQGNGNRIIAQGHNGVNPRSNHADTTPPRMARGEIDGDRMTIYFSEPLNENAAGGSFYMALQTDNCRCWSGGAVDAPLEISGNKVTVDFEGRVRAREGLWASTNYLVRPGEGARLRDLAGNRVRTPDIWYDGTSSTPTLYLDNLTGRPFVKPVPAGGVFSPPGVAVTSHSGVDQFYVDGDSIRVTLTFSEAVDVTGTPRVRIDLDPAAGGERWADYTGGSGTEMLKFEYTVVDGDSSDDGVAVLQDTLALNGGAVRSASAITVENARLGHDGLDHDPLHKVVTPATQPPVLLSADASGATLTLTFSEPLGAAASLDNSAFTVKKTPQGSAEETVTLSGSPAIDGDTVTLSLTAAVLDTDTGVKVSYEKPGSGTGNRLIDVAGNETASFSDEPVVSTADTTPPRLLRGEIDGDTITLYFSEPLDETTGGKGDYYRINLQWGSLLGGAEHHGRCRSHSYRSWYTFTTEPREVYAQGNTVVVVGLQQSDRVRAGVSQNFNNFYYAANTDKPADQRVRDLSGNHVYTPRHKGGGLWASQAITIPSTTRLPYPKYATVDRNRLVLTFSAPMDEDSRPSASAFRVKVNGSAVSLAGSNPVAISGNDVTLTLASNVAQGASVMVSYVKPSGGPLQNVICEDAPSFSDMSVTVGNLTGVGPAVSGVAVTSDAGDDNTYGLGDTIEVAVTFSAAVDVDTAGTVPRLKIKMDPRRGEFWANYNRGSGTDTLTFAYTVAEPNTSPQGIAVLANTLELNGGKIRLMTDRTINARLAHFGLGHNPSHQVDWRQ